MVVGTCKNKVQLTGTAEGQLGQRKIGTPSHVGLVLGDADEV